MKTVIFFNTFVKMKGYDFTSLNLHNIKKIAFVAANEYDNFTNYFPKLFDQIISIDMDNGTLNYEQSKIALNNILKDIADKNLINLICLSEDNLLVVAKLREDFHLKGMSVAQTEKFRDKVKMKDALRKSGVALPTYQEMDAKKVHDLESYYQELVKSLGNKFVIKPKALLGAMGVSIINNYSEFDAAMLSIKDYHNYEIETFISGKLYHIDSIRADGKSIFQVCCEYSCPNFDFQLGKPLLSIPLKNDHPVVKQAQELAEKVLNTLDYRNGGSHLEFFVNDKNQLIFLEVAARTPGGMSTTTYSRMFDFNMLNADLCLNLGLPISDPKDPTHYYFSGMFPISEGKVINLINPNISGEYDISWRVKVGDTLNKCKSLRDIAATIVVSNNDFELAYADFLHLSKASVLALS